MAQLGAARRGFDAVAGAAAAGDYNSLLRVQDYATSYLSISRNVNGSGLRYAQDFEHVIASQAVDGVVAVAAVDGVVDRVAGQGIVASRGSEDPGLDAGHI